MLSTLATRNGSTHWPETNRMAQLNKQNCATPKEILRGNAELEISAQSLPLRHLIDMVAAATR
jgi:hypothetical protein